MSDTIVTSGGWAGQDAYDSVRNGGAAGLAWFMQQYWHPARIVRPDARTHGPPLVNNPLTGAAPSA